MAPAALHAECAAQCRDGTRPTSTTSTRTVPRPSGDIAEATAKAAGPVIHAKSSWSARPNPRPATCSAPPRVEAVFTDYSRCTGVIPPTINLHKRTRSISTWCPTRRQVINTVMSNNFRLPRRHQQHAGLQNELTKTRLLSRPMWAGIARLYSPAARFPGESRLPTSTMSLVVHKYGGTSMGSVEAHQERRQSSRQSGTAPATRWWSCRPPCPA